MNDANLYEYAVIRYVPRVERGEFVNVGLIMMCKRRRWLRVRVQVDESKIGVFNPPHTPAQIREALSLFCMFDADMPDVGRHPALSWPVEERFRWLTAVKSACLATSRPHPGYAEDLDSEFDRLYAELVV